MFSKYYASILIRTPLVVGEIAPIQTCLNQKKKKRKLLPHSHTVESSSGHFGSGTHRPGSPRTWCPTPKPSCLLPPCGSAMLFGLHSSAGSFHNPRLPFSQLRKLGEEISIKSSFFVISLMGLDHCWSPPSLREKMCSLARPGSRVYQGAEGCWCLAYAAAMEGSKGRWGCPATKKGGMDAK